MSASLLTLALLGCFLQVFSQSEVFRQAPKAHKVFLRPKRANQFLVEEILQGNLERECLEERCNFEEAREVFEDHVQTVAFWTVYVDGDQCRPNPCLNGGNCTDKVGGFSCSCPAPSYGSICELGAPKLGGKTSPDKPHTPGLTQPTAEWKSGAYKIRHHEMSKCPTKGPKACHQLCTADYGSFTCSCISGFKLQSDGRSCLPEVEFPCGRLSDASASACRHGNCPWQVTVINNRGTKLCGGVVLGQRSILTTASCLFLNTGSDLQPSHFYVTTGNRKPIPVRALYLHDRFRSGHNDYDLTLLELTTPLTFSPTLIQLCLPTKDFSENILMNSGRTGVMDRRRGQNRDLVYMTLDDCRRTLIVSHPLSNKMFCMMGPQEPSENPNRPQKVLSQNETEPSANQNNTFKINRLLWNHRAPRRPEEHTQNRIQNLTHDRTPTRAEPFNSTSKSPDEPSHGTVWSRSEVSRLCDGLLPGSPVATVEKGTAFLTGLLMTSSRGCDGQVFSKVSRYLSWIRPRLQIAEDHMTPQISQYPEDH
ncbi:protein Z, vitamin K-dependent plasma glycoprotein b isoform X2 [Nothobranchius furzeri]|nr:protein Z, vitamin K-dependent plasma glycoprotein b isoform X2 [Nothobranchius furzeri]